MLRVGVGAVSGELLTVDVVARGGGRATSVTTLTLFCKKKKIPAESVRYKSRTRLLTFV